MRIWRLLLVFGCIAVCSCSTLPFDRKVENNVFTSKSQPDIRVEVSTDFTYIGKVSTARHHQKVQGTQRLLVNYNSYLFANIDSNNYIKQGVIIRLDKVNKSFWQSDLFADVKNKLVSDYVEFDGERYEHFVAVRSDIFSKDEIDFIISEGMKNIVATTDSIGRLNYRGYSIPKCFMVEGFGKRAGVGNDIRACVYYFQDLSEIDDEFQCRDWVRGDVSGNEIERAYKIFLKRRNNDVKISKKSAK